MIDVSSNVYERRHMGVVRKPYRPRNRSIPPSSRAEILLVQVSSDRNHAVRKIFVLLKTKRLLLILLNVYLNLLFSSFIVIFAITVADSLIFGYLSNQNYSSMSVLHCRSFDAINLNKSPDDPCGNPPKKQYTGSHQWQRDMTKRGIFEKQETYWKTLSKEEVGRQRAALSRCKWTKASNSGCRKLRSWSTEPHPQDVCLWEKWSKLLFFIGLLTQKARWYHEITRAD